MVLSKSSRAGIFRTKARCIKTAGFDTAHASPIFEAQNHFWKAPGDHCGLPGAAFSGPGRAVSKPGVILAFWEFITNNCIKDTPAH